MKHNKVYVFLLSRPIQLSATIKTMTAYTHGDSEPDALSQGSYSQRTRWVHERLSALRSTLASQSLFRFTAPIVFNFRMVFWGVALGDFRRFLLGTGRMPHPVGGDMGVTLCHYRERGYTRFETIIKYS